MIALVLFASLLIAYLVANSIIYIAQNPKTRSRWGDVRLGFADFKKADNDDDRQRLLIKTGLNTLLLSSVFFVFCTVLCVIAFLPLWLFDLNTVEQVTYFSALTVASVLFLRNKKSGSNLKKTEVDKQLAPDFHYSKLDRLLHRLALGSKTVRRVSFDIEQLFSSKPQGSRCIDSPVYVCGLARSGTTMLLRILDQVDSLASLNYRDMPFVMAPNLWKKLSGIGAREAQLSERAHGDGIQVSYDSPEAFEEIFWQTYCEPIRRGTDCYGLVDPSEETLADFAEYRRLVVSSKAKTRYLSKNNNNLTRISALLKERTAKVLLVYRDPVETARSLHRQHQRFSASQIDDPFTLHYMEWLGHHEFGLAYKPFCFATSSQHLSLKPDTIDYWLDYWNAVYRHVLNQKSGQIHLVHHDSMRMEPKTFLAKLFKELELTSDACFLSQDIKPHAATQTTIPKDISLEITESAYATYGLILADARNVLVIKNKENHG